GEASVGGAPGSGGAALAGPTGEGVGAPGAPGAPGGGGRAVGAPAGDGRGGGGAGATAQVDQVGEPSAGSGPAGVDRATLGSRASGGSSSGLAAAVAATSEVAPASDDETPHLQPVPDPDSEPARSGREIAEAARQAGNHEDDAEVVVTPLDSLPADDDIDLDDLVDAPPEAVWTPMDRLADAFPGSELVDDVY
ncbi:MAG: hypothetical protein AAGG08_06230, partial [Actinomycetota bacterium]